MAASKLRAGDTPVPVLAPGRDKTRTGRLWVCVRDGRPAAGTVAPAVWFVYTENRKGEHSQRHLARYRGILQADAYGGYQAIYGTGQVVEAACWAHVRRKFCELHQARPSAVTAEALRRIGQLYAIEAGIRGKPSDERCRIRQAESRPLLDALQAWLRSTMETLSRKSDTTAAILYALNRWQALVRYCDDGAIEIDNSAAEWALRGVALGRKSYLFVGADSGGERAAALYSLIETAKLNGKRHFHLPAPDEPCQDLPGRGGLIGTQKRLRRKLAVWVAYQYPTQRHRRHAAVSPERYATGDFHYLGAMRSPAS